MNVALNGDQSDTKAGTIRLPATADLTGKENRLVKITSSSGAKFALPAAVTDLALFILMSGDVAANDSSAEVPSTNENARVSLKGTCVPGDRLILADPTASAGVHAGQVEALAAQAAGQYFSPGIAEEVGVDGQNVKFRYDAKTIRITEALVLTSATTAAATDLATSEALANANKADLATIKTHLQTQGLVS
jgi:hypothetical protein